MSNEWLNREVLRRVKYFEEYVRGGGDGFIEMLELMEWLKENDKKEVFDVDEIVKMLNNDVKDWFLGWMIINYCRK